MRISTTMLSILGVVLLGCPSDDGGGTGGSSGSSTTEPTTTTLSTTTMSTTMTSTTMSTTDSTSMSTTDGSSSTDATTTGTESSGSGDSTGTGTGTSGSSDSGPGEGNENGQCAQQDESCLDAQCCGNLDCCEGVPIPQGQAICLAQCPDSDRNIKHGFTAVDVDQVLDRVATLPITTWTYDDDPSGARHIGPMAQDFRAAFAVGGSDKAIAKVDADGVALAGVQALHRRVQDLQRENDELRATLSTLQSRLEKLERSE